MAVGFFYLDSRNEIDYGIMMDSSDPNDLRTDFIPELRTTENSSMITQCVFYTGVSDAQKTMTAEGREAHQEVKFKSHEVDSRRMMLNSFFKNGAAGATRLSIERLRGKPDVGRFLEVGPLVTYSKEEGWNIVRFSVVKCLEDNSFWVVAQQSFYGNDDDEGTIYAMQSPTSASFLWTDLITPFHAAASEQTTKALSIVLRCSD